MHATWASGTQTLSLFVANSWSNIESYCIVANMSVNASHEIIIIIVIITILLLITLHYLGNF